MGELFNQPKLKKSSPQEWADYYKKQCDRLRDDNKALLRVARAAELAVFATSEHGHIDTCDECIKAFNRWRKAKGEGGQREG